MWAGARNDVTDDLHFRSRRPEVIACQRRTRSFVRSWPSHDAVAGCVLINHSTGSKPASGEAALFLRALDCAGVGFLRFTTFVISSSDSGDN